MVGLARSGSVGCSPLKLVGMARFELTTPASRRQCSTRLSYTPTQESKRRFERRILHESMQKWIPSLASQLAIEGQQFQRGEREINQLEFRVAFVCPGFQRFLMNHAHGVGIVAQAPVGETAQQFNIE